MTSITQARFNIDTEREREREMSLTWVDGGRVDMNGKCGSKREYVNVWERMKILWKLVFFFVPICLMGKLLDFLYLIP